MSECLHGNCDRFSIAVHSSEQAGLAGGAHVNPPTCCGSPSLDSLPQRRSCPPVPQASRVRLSVHFPACNMWHDGPGWLPWLGSLLALAVSLLVFCSGWGTRTAGPTQAMAQPPQEEVAVAAPPQLLRPPVRRPPSPADQLQQKRRMSAAAVPQQHRKIKLAVVGDMHTNWDADRCWRVDPTRPAAPARQPTSGLACASVTGTVDSRHCSTWHHPLLAALPCAAARLRCSGWVLTWRCLLETWERKAWG